MAVNKERRSFPASAGVFLGLGLGGFFDGIVFHQLLQWHHMLTSVGYPANTLRNLEINTFWDGLFHASTYVFVVVGLVLLWRASHRVHLWWCAKLVFGTVLIGFGLFNLVEGLINHHLLGLHYVNETVPESYWFYWDVGFLVAGLYILLIGWALYQAGKRKSPGYNR